MNRVLRFLTDWSLWLYNIALLLASPVVLFLKALRFWRKGWKREYDMARWFIPEVGGEEPSTPRVVLVGTGWGEMRLVELLDKELKTHQPQAKTIWVLRDRDAILEVRKHHPHQAITWLPFDFIVPVLLWLKVVRPDVVVFTEKFWFPNLVRGCRNYGAKIMVSNARTRSHEKSRYKILESFHRWVMDSFDALVFQSDEDARRAKRVLSPRTETVVAGNLKFALRPPVDASKTESLRTWLNAPSTSEQSTPVLAAGSVEAGDVEFVLDAFEEVRREYSCRLLIAPRRLHYALEIEQLARAKNWTVNLRSQNTSETTDIYILDSMGELASAYQFCAAAFIGGTLKIGAGHNVVEPLLFGKPVSYGPNRGFFESVQIACEKAGVGFRLNSSELLAAHWQRVLSGEEFIVEIEDRAAQLLQLQSAALLVNAKVLLSLFND